MSFTFPIRLFLILIVFAVSFPVLGEEKTKPIFVHYMPWYASKPFSGKWGWHWTMGKCDPDKGEIASHDTPLIGPYDSNDPDLITYHVQLMKHSGVDGVIVDWYGIKDYYDYAMIHRSTQKFFTAIKQAGLKFMLCYEDQTIKHMTKGKALSVDRAVDHGKEVFSWVQKHWMSDPSYFRVNGKPQLLVFGPQYFNAEQFKTILSVCNPKPDVYFLRHTLNNPDIRAIAKATFGWPPVHGKGVVDEKNWHSKLSEVYKKYPGTIPAAFPSFNDYYSDAGLKEGYGVIESNGGQTFKHSLAMAMNVKAPFIQLVTWNDFGEGTVIEPTQEMQYTYLVELQRVSKSPHTIDDLKEITQSYLDKKKNKN